MLILAFGKSKTKSAQSNSSTPRRKTNKTKSKTETTEHQVMNKENRGKVSLRTADVFPVVASLPPKKNVWESERQNDFRDVKPF